MNEVQLFVIVKNISTHEQTDNSYLGVNEYIGLEYINAYLNENHICSSVTIVKTQQISSIVSYVHTDCKIAGFCLYVDIVHDVLLAANLLRHARPDLHIVLGGPQVVGFEKQILIENSSIDSIITGEGEETFLELSRRVFNHLSLQDCLGTTYRNENNIICQNQRRSQIVNLDRLPFPSRRIFETARQDFILICGSRGCRGSCSFCEEISFKRIFKKPHVRHRNAKSIVDEIEGLQQQYSIRSFRFTDPTFDDMDDYGNKKAEDVFDEIEKRKLIVRLHVFSRAELNTPDNCSYLQKASKNGLECVYVGVESGNQQDLQLYHKIASVNQSLEAIKTIKENGIHAAFGFIMFNPYSTLQTLYENAEFLHQSGLGHVFYLFQTRLEVLAQTPIRHRIENDGLMDKRLSYKATYYSYRFQNPVIRDVFDAVKYAYQKTPLYYMDTTLAMDRIWARRMFSNTKEYSRLMGLYKQINDINHENNEKNYMVMMRILDMFENGAALKQVNEYTRQMNLEKYHDTIETLYTKIRILIQKMELLYLK